ncbi:MAG: hypothetical protein ABI867_05520 [Kofleriaceae bacterium]
MLLGITQAAADPPIDRAKAAVEASDYLTAKTALGEALAAGTNSPDQLAEVYRLTGIVTGALGDTDASTDAFTRCLALAPKATLPPGTSPKIAKPFATAQAYFTKHEPLKIKTETAAEPAAVTVIVVSDPLKMIARVQAVFSVDAGAEQTLEQASAKQTKIALPKGKRLDIRIAALDSNGNHVAELGSVDVPIVIVGPATSGGVAKPRVVVTRPSTPAKPRPLYLRWWLWGAATVAVAGAGVYFGLDAVSAKNDLDELNATSSNHTFDEAKDVESHARRSVLLTNIALGTAGGLAVVTAILYLTRPTTKPQERRVVLAPLRDGGAAIVFGGGF